MLAQSQRAAHPTCGQVLGHQRKRRVAEIFKLVNYSPLSIGGRDLIYAVFTMRRKNDTI
jgi:hypothetical protein